jgi:segregation and condensation protein A
LQGPPEEKIINQKKTALYEFKLEIFQGPLDLLLYLIKKNEIDIYDIPIATITDQYLHHLELLEELDLDLAGEYLVMAATLILIKAKMLLPRPEMVEEEEEQDPREELVAQLVDYQAFKAAALELAGYAQLERDVFTRGGHVDEGPPPPEEEEPLELGLFDLARALKRVLWTREGGEVLAIDRENLSLAEKINLILARLASRDGLTLAELLEEAPDRIHLVYTLLALLELAKMGRIRVYQFNSFGTIRVFAMVG